MLLPELLAVLLPPSPTALLGLVLMNLSDWLLKSETTPVRPVSSLHGLSFQVWKTGNQPTSRSTPKGLEKPR